MNVYLTQRFAAERRMPAQTVNLDALIRRDDFAMVDVEAGGAPRQNLSLTDLAEGGFFASVLRKPDFQRETTHWTPQKIVDLVLAFLDGDLIPAVILWQRGSEIFVIDGAHRLSALIAWVKNDYGDQADSIAMFGSGITDEQKNVAEKTRKLMRKEVGTYSEFQGLLRNSDGADQTKKARLARIGVNSLVIQWVTANKPEAAEASFFKINQAAQPIDPTERRILQSRRSPNAIAARCIVRGGRGHKYWGDFEESAREEIERLGSAIYEQLYKPPHADPVSTTDLPIAGRGYNALPFVFDLVNLVNGIPLPTSQTVKKVEAPQPPDETGDDTIKYLKTVERKVSLVSTNNAGSLGFHPLIYYYSVSGSFLPNAFLASISFAEMLDRRDKKRAFTEVRSSFEDYIFKNKVFVSLTITRLGSGSRSLGRIVELYWRVFLALMDHKTPAQITKSLTSDPDFVHLAQAKIPAPNANEKPSRGSGSKSAKSASFIKTAMATVVKCAICGGALHQNSVSFDHKTRVREGGGNYSDNLQPSHPYCNSGYKS